MRRSNCRIFLSLCIHICVIFALVLFSVSDIKRQSVFFRTPPDFLSFHLWSMVSGFSVFGFLFSVLCFIIFFVLFFAQSTSDVAILRGFLVGDPISHSHTHSQSHSGGGFNI